MMKQLFRIFMIAIFAVSVFAAAARAAELTGEEAGKFVKALPDIEAFSDKLRVSGKDKELNAALQPVPGDKTYSPYVKGAQIMKEKMPEEYKELEGITARHGFKSAEEWASSGDSVMLAYMAIRFDAENPDALKQLKNIPAETMAKMDPAMKAQLEQSISMMEIFTGAPKKDREVVKPHMKEINAWLERSKKEAAPADAGTKKSAE